jgi:pimeloyl-ACP methyl ester carboxylesterase
VDDLDKLQLPLLVIQGSADPFGTMQHARLIQERAGRTLLIVELPASGHNPHMDAELVTLGALARFLRGMENGRSDNGRQKRKDSANLAKF